MTGKEITFVLAIWLRPYDPRSCGEPMIWQMA